MPPSPKSHARLVTIPLEASVKFTSNVAAPLGGLPVKAADGVIAAEPVTAFVEIPPLLAKTTDPVNDPAEPGSKLMLTTTVCPAFTLNGLPLARANPAPDAVAVPLSVCNPVLAMENDCVLLWPTCNKPKSRLPGTMVNCGGLLVTTI